ncbi:DUF427 domain-containing protein [Treponema sp.]
MKALWNGKTLAESKDIVMVEGNAYFPSQSLKMEYLKDSQTHTTCVWKGVASYYSLEVDGKVNEDAAWYYPEPKKGAERVMDRVAFWKGVEIVE